MIIFALNFSKQYYEVLKIYDFGLKNLYDIEKEHFSISSAEIGTKVFRLWNMPETFIDVMEKQNFLKEDIEKVSDIDRLTRLSEILGKRMLNIVVTQEEENLERVILGFYQISEETRGLFGQDYYDMIREHPFFAMALESHN